MTIPGEVAYVIGGGIAYLIIKDVFKFVKYLVDKWSAKSAVEVNPGSQEDMTDGEVLRSILGKMDNIVSGMNQLKVDFGIYKTKLDFMARAIKGQGSSIKATSAEFGKLAIECAKRLATCGARFDGLEKDVDSMSGIKTKKGNG